MKKKFGRGALIALSLFVILGSGYYSYNYGRKQFFSFKDLCNNPERSEGKIFVLNYRKIVTVGPGYFTVKEGDTEVMVEGHVSGLKVGDVITVKGVFKKEGYLSLISYYLSPYRNRKYILSCLGAAFPLIYFLFYFRWNFRKGGWEGRFNA